MRWQITINGNSVAHPDKPDENWVFDDGVEATPGEEGFTTEHVQAYVHGLEPKPNTSYAFEYVGETEPPAEG